MDETTDGSAPSTGPVFRLVYGSHSLIPLGRRALGLGEVFATARRNNRRLEVTGALMISDDSFVICAGVLGNRWTTDGSPFGLLASAPRRERYRRTACWEASSSGRRDPRAVSRERRSR